MKIKSVCIPVFLLLLQIFAGCSQRPYLKGNAFSEIGITPQKNNRCIAMVFRDKISYFLCEPEDRTYRIKIILADMQNAVCMILPEQPLSGDPFSNVIEKEIKQIRISVNYFVEPSLDPEMIKQGKSLRLFIKSSDGEKHNIEGLFFVDDYSEDTTGHRGNLR